MSKHAKPTSRTLTGLVLGSGRAFPGLRVTQWQGAPDVALVAPAPSGQPPSTQSVLDCCRSLALNGIARIVTPALSEVDAEPFRQANFIHTETLHLLIKSLVTHPPDQEYPTKGGRFYHLDRVLAIDSLAFDQFWRFDRIALSEARNATPQSRYRVAMSGNKVVGYHVTGRSGSRGYLQRIAVDPNLAGQGIGTSLVYDCLSWLYENSVTQVLVNTQQNNQRALELYERLGFVRQESGLSVLTWKAERP